MTELFASTPRPRAQRTLPTLAAMAVAAVGSYLGVGIAGGLWIVDTARYVPVQAFAVTAVGVLALMAISFPYQPTGVAFAPFLALERLRGNARCLVHRERYQGYPRRPA